LDDVQVLDSQGKKIAWTQATKLLKEETVAMASLWGQPVDPLHLRVLKDGTLTFLLPAPKPQARGVPGILPAPAGPVLPPARLPPGAAPPAPPAGLPGAPGVTPPPVITPATPAPPAPPA